MHVFRDGLEFNNTHDIIGEFRNPSAIHEHDFTTVIKTEKETLLVCSSSSSGYCARCSKFVMVNDKKIKV
jgi:hypothetical protein